MRIAMILANACAPDPRVEKEAAALGSAGHDVTILAWDRLGRHTAHERREGFSIDRVGPRAPYGGGVKSLPLFRRFWHITADRAAAASPDVIHCHDTDTIPAGTRALKRLGGKDAKLVVDFHELYGASSMVPQRGLAGAAARGLVDRIEKRAVAEASLVIVANPGTADHYRAIGARGKLIVVDNAPDPRLFSPRACPESDRPFTVTFVGSKRYLRTLTALMDAVRDETDVRVVLAGGGPHAERVAELACGRENVEIHGQVPYADIPGYYACCDVVHAAYDAIVGNVLYTIPGKVIEAMACAKPVIVSAGTWAGDFVTKKRVGLAVAGDDPRQIAVALRQLRDDPQQAAEMGRRGRAIVEGGLNWPTVAGRLVDAYNNLT